MFDVQEILSEAGPLADRIDGFTVRPQQQQLAQTIADVLNNDDSLVFNTAAWFIINHRRTLSITGFYF